MYILEYRFNFSGVFQAVSNALFYIELALDLLGKLIKVFLQT